ncbi:hypothetical protein Tco_0522829 [Tanacetum coccineum]
MLEKITALNGTKAISLDLRRSAYELIRGEIVSLKILSRMRSLFIWNIRFLKNTEEALMFNVNETIGFDKSKWNVLKLATRGGHLLGSTKLQGIQDNKNKESSKRSVYVETSTSTALVSCDGLGGYD